MGAAPAAEVREGLQLIRTRQRRTRHVLLGLVAFVLAAAWINEQPSPADFQIPFVVAALAYGALLLAYSLRLAFTECPQCHGYYHYKLWLDPWTRNCLHCGLPLARRPD